MAATFFSTSANALTVEEQLVYADKLKDSNPAALPEILQKISSELLSPLELELYTYLRAYSEFQKQNVNEAVSALKQLSSQAKSNVRYRALISLVDFHTTVENWSEGISSAKTLSEAIESVDDKLISNLAFASLSIFFNDVGNFDAALKNAQKLLNNTTLPKQKCLAKANELIAKIEKQYQTVSKAEVVNGIESCQGAENIDWKNKVILNHSKILLKDKDIKTAITQLSDALPELENSGNTELIAHFYAMLSKAYLSLGDYNNANLFASKSISTYGLRKDKESALVAFDTLYQVAQHNNNLHQALIFHKSYFAASDAYLQSIRSRQLAIQQNKLDNVKNQTILSLLDQENELLKTRAILEQKSRENNQLALALAFSLIVLLIFWSYRSRRSQTKLRQLVNSDELTGIATRNYFRDISNIALQQSKAVKNNACFILFDLDNFKRVNDKFGHLAGDLALKHAVDTVKNVCRTNDLIARMGGEEFAILVQNCPLSQAKKIAEECRVSLQKLTFENDYPGLHITASFGVADTNQCGYQYEKIFAHADAAMYKAKAFGRNKVYVFNNEQLTLKI